MSDIIDKTDERDELFNAARIAAVRARADTPPGAPGECDFCGEWSGRLIGGACAPCRDKRRLP